MTVKKTFLLGLTLMVTAISCNQKPENETATVATSHEMHQAVANPYQMGDRVPSNLVCMVNNEYMGHEQLVVDFEGKTYYGCCEMCQERIPKDPTVRTAIDPYSKKEVDKSLAVIAITGPRGAVSYFENEENYKKFIEQQKM